jgi:hypothetical protein
MNAACGWTLIRKTSLLRKINPMMRRSSFTNKDIYNPLILSMNERRNVPEIVIVNYELLRRSQTRINLLFTMSEIPHARPVKEHACEVMFRGRYFRVDGQPVFALSSFAGHASIAMPGCATHSRRRSVVEPDGIEPTTSCLQSTRSPS